MTRNTPYIWLVKFQLVRQIPDVYVSACVLAGKLFLLFFLALLYFCFKVSEQNNNPQSFVDTHASVHTRSWSAYPWIGKNIARKS